MYTLYQEVNLLAILELISHQALKTITIKTQIQKINNNLLIYIDKYMLIYYNM